MKKRTTTPTLGPLISHKLYECGSLTLRQYYAAKTMQGLMANNTGNTMSMIDAVETSFNVADAMIKFEEAGK